MLPARKKLCRLILICSNHPVQDFSPVATVFTSHVDAFWSFYLVDLREAMRVDDTIIVKLQLFHTVNQYFCSQRECV